jgi:hypothetical protein
VTATRPPSTHRYAKLAREIDKCLLHAITFAHENELRKDADAAREVTDSIKLAIETVATLDGLLRRDRSLRGVFTRAWATAIIRTINRRLTTKEALNFVDLVILDFADPDFFSNLLDALRPVILDVHRLIKLFPADPERTFPERGDADLRNRPCRSARWVTGRAVWLLPPTHRPRYAEEYARELADLAAENATRRQQLDYGLQVLFNAFSLRRAVGKPVAQQAKDG